MDILSNYEKAKKVADAIDDHIIEVLKSGKSFRVEAGAGSGKTYSLKKVIDWLQANRGREFKSKQKKVACITYTNAAVDVIKSRLSSESPITPSTIHAFAWESMSRFQSSILTIVKEKDILPKGQECEEIKKVAYTLGVRYVEKGCLYLYHDDVIKIFSELLEKPKFRMVLADMYPIILIDEYQDSFKSIIGPIIQYYIEKEIGPQFGFFGDSWQTIYASNGACGLIESEKLEVISKESNFRSQKCIVDMLNRMRPTLPQISALDDEDGKITVITTNEFNDKRIFKGYYKGELQDDLRYEVVDNVSKALMNNGWKSEKTKILMITHKMLSRQQGYEKLLGILDKRLKEADDVHIVFFMERLEPIFKALKENDTQALYEALGTSRQTVSTKAQKKAWKVLCSTLEIARTKTIFDVVKCAYDSQLIPIPSDVEDIFRGYPENEANAYANASIGLFYQIPYSEVLCALEYLKPSSLFSTDHGVKGEEYENVLFVVGRGWNDYKFDEVLCKDESKLSDTEAASYRRNRNLFYVCCSRPIKNLTLLVTVPTNVAFEQYLTNVFGKENIISYSNFMANMEHLDRTN